MSLTHRKRHVTRNTRSRKLVRDFFRLKEDCLNNNDLQTLNRTIAEISDIIQDAQNDEANFFSDWSYSWDEDEIDKDFWETGNADEEPEAEQLQDAHETQQDETYYILGRSEIEALLEKLPKIHESTLLNHI